ncbi:MAG TPA: hypothetical protein VHA75_11500 [Rugosimonospora sp.]|nr:hypothetical protein [Rugosimonospora sp.]
MTVTTYAGWVADGKPAKPAQPIADMMAMFARHGYTVYWYPDARHQQAPTPEDHDPYSHTPWPGTQPYPYVLACDLMPKSGTDARALTPIARRIIADKRAGRAPWVKYLNWTDEDGKVWHTKWQPDESTTSSTDSGHLHISIRTDYVTSTAAAGWDPVEPLQGTTAQEADVNQTDKITGNLSRGNTVGDFMADQVNERDWWYGVPGTAAADGKNPPPPGSRLDLLMKFVQSGGITAAPVDPTALAVAVKAALSDPGVLAGLAKAVNDDAAARLAE